MWERGMGGVGEWGMESVVEMDVRYDSAID